MSKYYLKHTNASGISWCHPVTAIGAFFWIVNLYTGESITIIRSGDQLEQKLSEHPALYEEL